MLITSCRDKCGASDEATSFEHLRLDGEQDRVEPGERSVDRTARRDAELLRGARAGFVVDVDRVEIGRRDAALDESADERGGHVAAADEGNFHGEFSETSV
jgi:hypothetical protein